MSVCSVVVEADDLKSQLKAERKRNTELQRSHVALLEKTSLQLAFSDQQKGRQHCIIHTATGWSKD